MTVDFGFLKKVTKDFIKSVRPDFFEQYLHIYRMQESIFDYQLGYSQEYRMPTKNALQDWCHNVKLGDLKVNEGDVSSKYLTSLLSLPTHQFNQALKSLNEWFWASRRLEQPSRYCPRIEIQFTESKECSALEWLLTHIQELHISGLDFSTGRDRGLCKIPYRQCIHCGRLNEDSVGTPFSTRKRFCHLSACPTDAESSPNPANHEPGCCFALWKKPKKEFAQKIRYQVKCGYSTPSITSTFLKFCETRYEQNLSMANPVRDTVYEEFLQAFDRYQEARNEGRPISKHPLEFLRSHYNFPAWREKEIQRRQRENPDKKLFFPELINVEYKLSSGSSKS